MGRKDSRFHATGVSSKKDLGAFNVDGVLKISGRVILRQIGFFKIIFVGFYFWPFGHGVTVKVKKLVHLADDDCIGSQMSDSSLFNWQCDVEPLVRFVGKRMDS